MGSLPPAGYYHDQPFLAAGGGAHARTVLLTWIEVLGEATLAERQSIHAAVSTDGGLAWSKPVVVHEGGIFRGARPAVSDDGELLVAMLDLRSDPTNRQAWLARSTDRGRDWHAVPLDGVTSAHAAPLLAEGGRLHLVTTERDAQDVEQVTLRSSDDGGMTWQRRPLHPPEAPGLTTPALAADRQGTLHASFLSPLPGGGNTLLAARVPQDGDASLAVANRTSIGTNEPWGVLGWPTLGDYMGLAGTSEGAIAAWVSGDAPDHDVRITRIR